MARSADLFWLRQDRQKRLDTLARATRRHQGQGRARREAVRLTNLLLRAELKARKRRAEPLPDLFAEA